jgi:RNA polymerase sigma-70 factor, ECF subfamily
MWWRAWPRASSPWRSKVVTERATPLRQLFEEHAPFVCRSLRRLGVPEADLDDALQEVFLVVHRRIADYEDRGRLRAWLYTICAHVVRAERRRHRRRRETLTPDPPEAVSGLDPQRSAEDAQSLALGKRVLAQLKPELRDVFVLYELEELPMREVAEALGCPLQTAYSRLHAARARVLEEARRQREENPSP